MLKNLLSRACAPRTSGTETLLAEAEQARASRDLAGAERLLRQALEIDAQDARSWELLGVVLREAGQPADGLSALSRASQLSPESARIRCEFGNALLGAGRVAEAEVELMSAIERDPALAEAHLNLGIARRARIGAADALSHFERAVALRPDRPLFLLNLAACLRELDRHGEAEQALRAALAAEPGNAFAAIDLAGVLRETGRPEESIKLVAPLLAGDGVVAEAHAALARALHDVGDFDAAREEFDKAIALAPNDADLRFVRGLHRLAMGDFEHGWDEYEARLATAESPRRGFEVPDWRGERLSGKSILVYAEQGIGDEIMFASCVPDLVEQGARVVLECDARLARLFARSFPSVRIVEGRLRAGDDWAAVTGSVDFQVAAGSLPSHFRRGADRFPQHSGYLCAEPSRVESWRRRLDALGPGLKVGLSWRGGLAKTRSAVRSLSLAALQPLLAAPNCRFVSLQHGSIDADLAALGRIAPTHWPDAHQDMDELAALISAVDVVISVCNATVHLAGALGCEAWVMTPASPEWRYMARGGRMPWYPSVRLVRQPRRDDWTTIVTEVLKLIERRP